MKHKNLLPMSLRILFAFMLLFWVGCDVVEHAEESAIAPVGVGAVPASDETVVPRSDPAIRLTVQDREEWNVLYIGDVRVGYSRSKVFTKEDLIHVENETAMVIKRFGQELKTRTLLESTETDLGVLREFSFSMHNPPSATVESHGKVSGSQLTITGTTAGKSSQRTMEWDPNVRSPVYQDLLLGAKPMKVGETRRFRAFLPEFAQVSEMVIHATERKATPLLDGTSRDLLQVEISTRVSLGNQAQVFVMKASLDEQGRAIRSILDLGGLQMTSYAVEREEAMKSIAGAELDLAVDTLVRVDKIPDAHHSREIVYHLHASGANQFKFLPTGSTQRVKPIDSDTAELTVLALRGPSQPPAEPAAIAREFLMPSRYLQSDDSHVVELAKEGVGNETDPWKQAVLLEKFVHTKLTQKNFSTALGSAAEVARTLSGDCTEHACLLAAMCRAEKIPSRIAVGLVYVNSLNSFGGHMWTEVNVNGEWIPLDATLGQGGIGAAHIKLADSSFADDGITPVSCFLPLLNVLGKLDIEVIEVNP